MALALRMALAFVVLALLAAAPANAEPGFEYEEAERFGGFDESAYNHGQFGGPLTSGKFLDPTGFAVDPVDNTVYVVDRTSSAGASPTDWRIQEFDPKTGAVLGTTTFTLPNEPPRALKEVPRASAIEGLAVDDSSGRLYALIVGSPPPSSPYYEEASPPAVAQELLAWSTRPVEGGLVAANVAGSEEKLPADQIGSPIPHSPGTVGGVVSSEKQLMSGETLLYGPQGIAVDPLGSGVDDPVVIEADDLAIGATIVQQVATQQQGMTATGDLLAHWSSASIAGQLGERLGPHGISTSPDGTLNVLLDASSLPIEAYDVALKADLSKASVLDSAASVPPLADSDQSPMDGNVAPFSVSAGIEISNPKGAGPQAVQLSGAAGLYAGVTFSHETSDIQTSSTGPPGSEYWTSGENSGEEYEANIGVRLLKPEAGGMISSLQGRTIVNTLGAGRGKPCNIGAPEAALEAGAGGTLWILDRGPSTKAAGASGQGREVIELAPRTLSSARLCPQPTGTFTMTPAGGEPQSAEEMLPSGETKALEIPAGTQVTFSAIPVKHMGLNIGGVNRVGGKPFAYEWDLDGDPTNGPAGDGFEKVYAMQPEKYYFPPSSVTYTYTRPGEYKVRFRMRTDYGVYTPPLPGTVIVTKAPFHPEARFTATPSGGQQVTFNAAGSMPGVGTIVNYHWNWGDGGGEDEDPQASVVAHTYAQPGSYPVTLTVTNSAYQSATSAPQMVTVAAPPVAQAAVALTVPLYDIPPPFALYPIPPVPTDRAPTRLSPRARFAGGALSVTLACPAAKKLCAGSIGVETAATFAAAAKTGKRRHKPSRLSLGRATFSIPGGHSKTVKVRLSARGMALLKRLKHLKVLVIVAAHDSLGDPGVTTLRLTLSATATHAARRVSSKKHSKH